MDIETDLNLSDKECELLSSFRYDLISRRKNNVENDIQELIASHEFNSPESPHHNMAKAKLVAMVEFVEGSEKVSTLPGGVRELSDLTDPSKGHAMLEDIDEHIDFLKNEEGLQDDHPTIQALNTAREDTLTDLKNTGLLRDKHLDVVKELETAQQAQIEASVKEEKEAFFKRRRDENERLNISGEEVENLIAQEWSRLQNGY